MDKFIQLSVVSCQLSVDEGHEGDCKLLVHAVLCSMGAWSYGY